MKHTHTHIHTHVQTHAQHTSQSLTLECLGVPYNAVFTSCFEGTCVYFRGCNQAEVVWCKNGVKQFPVEGKKRPATPWKRGGA